MSLCSAPLLPLYSSSQGCHTATGTHMPHGITQCYLPPARGDIPALTPAEAGTRLSDPGGMQGWVVCVSVCQVMSVVCQYLPLKEDLDEHVTVYRCISHLYHSHLPHVSNYINVQNNYCLQCFGRQEGHPACKKNWVVRCWRGYLSAARCRLFAYGPADATASQNSIISCLF